MHITVICPSCDTRYQIDPSFRGVRMRCPNPDCRAVFEASEQSSPGRPSDMRGNGPPGPAPQGSGSVGDMVPILPAEQAEPAPSATEVRSWHDAPPVRRPAGNGPVTPPPSSPPAATPPSEAADWRAAPPPPRAAAPAARTRADGPRTPPPVRRAPPARAEAVAPPETPPPAPDTAGPSWENAPPVRLPVNEAPVEAEASGPVAEVLAAKRARRRARRLMAGMVLLVALVVGVGVTVGVLYVRGQEDRDAQQARQLFDQKHFAEAAAKFRTISQQFHDSPHAPEYQFFADLSEVRALLESPSSDADETLNTTDAFLKAHGQQDLVKSHGPDLGPPLVQWIVSKAEEVSQGEATLKPDFFERAHKTLQDTKAAAPDAITVADLDRVNQAFDKVRDLLARQAKRAALLQDLEALAAKPSRDAVREAREKIAALKREQPDIDQDAEVQGRLKAIEQALYAKVTYVAEKNPPSQPVGPVKKEEEETGLLMAQRLGGGVTPPGEPGDPVALALLRGVLYGLSQKSGDILWAMRVGIDTTTLPLRVPATRARPEMVLALSADTNTLTAVNVATGETIWRCPLGAPCLGRPIIVEPRAYIPTYDGKVHEIELAGGRELGHYELGQHLTVGGAHQEGSTLVYVPAEDQCVYVLNVKERRCQAVLYSGHPSGSLRGEPLVINTGIPGQEENAAAGPAGYLVLSQTAGLNDTALRAFALPVENLQSGPPVVRTKPTPGWPWFPPFHDPEKLVLATDAGVVSLFGIQQLHTQDQPLFPLVQKNDLHVEGGATAPGTRSARAQVVSCQDDSLWVLSHGGMQKFSLAWDVKAGRRFVVDPLWKEPLALGSPLHRAQTDATGSTLFTVTQSLRQRVCLATAVDAPTKKVLWQRQIGLVCQGAAVPLGREVFALDQGGGVFAFRPASYERRDEWQVGGQGGLAPPLDDNPDVPPSLHPGGDGKSVYEVAFPGKGTRLVLRRFRVDDQGRRLPFQQNDEKTVDLNAPPAGNVAVHGDNLLVPLQDGTLFRVKLPPDEGMGTVGPNWRAGRGGNRAARGYVAWVGGDDFVTSDGSRGLTHWRWPDGKSWMTVPDDKAPTVELSARLAAAPAVLPRQGDKGELQVCVADGRGNLVLLRGDRLEEVRRWSLGGRLTAGPFVRGGEVGCVVDGRRLVWIDPAKDDVRWEYAGGEGIVGEPQRIEDLLVVADEAGRFVGLDPRTGQVQGQYTLRASVAPAAPPVAFSAGRAFAPLTDGTVFLLPLEKLRGKK